MKTLAALLVIAGCAASLVWAQGPPSSFERGNALQSWQDPGIKKVLAKCKTSPKPFGIPISQDPNTKKAPPDPVLPATSAIPRVLAAGQKWKVVWSWEGNNVDGPIANEDGTVLFANNDANNVMMLDLGTGLAGIVHRSVNTGGAVSRSKN